jgi:hypothetical protein
MPSRRAPSPAWRYATQRLHRHPSMLVHLTGLLDYIRTVLEWLCKSANGADNVVVSMDAERDDGNEAEGEPRLTPDH